MVKEHPRWKKYLPGMPAGFSKSSKVSFSIPASLLVHRSLTTKDRILGSTISINSGIGKILSINHIFSLSFSWSLGVFFPFVEFVTTRKLA